MTDLIDRQAERFLRDEHQFRLGFLPTEQSHPGTRGLSEVMAENTSAGVTMIQSVDRDILHKHPQVLQSDGFVALTASLYRALGEGGQVVFSGCGATGRVSILLEAAWRRCRRQHPGWNLPDAVSSLMTGGDSALVRSVESLEDYAEAGRLQVRQRGLGPGDVLVAISEGGETSSVIGSAHQALDDGAEVYFVYNNPTDILCENIERSRQLIDDPRVMSLDLHTGPMAIAGSTRMQATTIELLVVGSALQDALLRLSGQQPPSVDRVARQFENLLDQLEGNPARSAIVQWVELEESVYRGKGAVTYFADRALLDIFTDTTERAPTFMLPPFRKCDDTRSPRSPAFVKCPLRDTPRSWHEVYQREPRCLNWSGDTARSIELPDPLASRVTQLTEPELYKFQIGNEPDESRFSTPHDVAMAVLVGDEAERLGAPDSAFMTALEHCARGASRLAVVSIGTGGVAPDVGDVRLPIDCAWPPSPIDLWQHLAVKLVLNTVSTATMTRLGRVMGNWMAHVETTNKKLIDRGTRLISELTGLPYNQACIHLHRSMNQLQAWDTGRGPRPSPVAWTIHKLDEKTCGEDCRF